MNSKEAELCFWHMEKPGTPGRKLVFEADLGSDLQIPLKMLKS